MKLVIQYLKYILIFELIFSLGVQTPTAYGCARRASATRSENSAATVGITSNQIGKLDKYGDQFNHPVINLDVVNQLSTECEFKSGQSASLSERCSKAIINVLSSYPFVLSEIVFFTFWWVYNFMSSTPFDQPPSLNGQGVVTTVSEETFGTFDVMNQKAITSEQDKRVDLQQEVIERSLDLVKTLKNYQSDPSSTKEALELSIENSRKLLKRLGLSSQGTDWQQHWDQAIQDLKNPDSFHDKVTDFLSRNLRSPEYLIAFTIALVSWIASNSAITDSIDPFPYSNLNTLLCAMTTVEFSLILQVMKRRAKKEKNRNATTELLDVKHLIQLIHHAEAASGKELAADSVALNIPTLNQIPVPVVNETSTQLNRGTQSINRFIASYPYIISLIAATGGWLAFNMMTSNPIDPPPSFPALNVTDAIIQEYYSSFEVIAQNSSHSEEIRLSQLHNALLGNILELTRLLSSRATHSTEELKSKIHEIRSILKEHGLPDSVAEMEAFYKEKVAQSKLNPDTITQFVSKYLRSWGYLGFLALSTATWMTVNSLVPGAIDPYPFVAFNIGLTIFITIQESFVIRIMLRQNDAGVMRHQKLYWLEAMKLVSLLERAESAIIP